MKTVHSTKTRDGKVVDETLMIYDNDLGVYEQVKEIVSKKFSEDAARTVRWINLEIKFIGTTPEKASCIVKFGRYGGYEE